MNADLVMGGQRQHRDLFTGSVGLPNVGTHVGSVVHAFETMAMNQVVETKAPQSRLIPGPIKLAGSDPMAPPPKPEKKFYKFPNRRDNSSSPVRKITLATDGKLENPMSSGLIRFDQDISPNQSDFDSTLRGDYRKHFHDTLLAERNESNPSTSTGPGEDNDQLLRGTMVSRSFIKNVRKPRKVSDGPIEMTTQKTKTYVKSQMIPRPPPPTNSGSGSGGDHQMNAPPATYVSNSAISKSTTTIFKPKSKDRALL